MDPSIDREAQVPEVVLFLSSPKDMQKERDIVVSEVKRWNASPTQRLAPKVRVIRWPEDFAGGASDYPQSVINRQLKMYDIFVSLVGARLGTPTPRAMSGTEEEFDRAIESSYRNVPIQLLLFFSNCPLRPSDIDPYQFLMVQAFRQKTERLGVLAHVFDSQSEFRHQFRNNLAAAYQNVREAKQSTSVSKKIMPVNDEIKTVAFGDVRLRKQINAPQWADHHLIPLAEYLGRHIVLHGMIETRSPYFRFGIKYYDAREVIFGPGSIQTFGQNMLIHVGKNLPSPTWFFTAYRAGIRLDPDRPLPNLDGSKAVRFAFEIAPPGMVSFTLNGERVFETYFQMDGVPCLALLAWGDEHDFTCKLRDLSLVSM